MKHAPETLPYDRLYSAWLLSMRKRVKEIKSPLLQVKTREDLWTAYLDGIPVQVRQEHNCNTCKAFIKRYGNLVYFDDTGVQRSLIWNVYDLPTGSINTSAVINLQQLVENGTIYRRFFAAHANLGTKVSHGFDHIAVDIHAANVCHEPNGEMSKHLQNVKQVKKYIAATKLEHLNKLSLLMDTVFKNGKSFKGQVDFLLSLYNKNLTMNQQNAAILLAPHGFCHPGNSAIDQIVQEIAAGTNDATKLTNFWNSLTNHLVYQRPTAEPKEGALDRAEKVFQERGLAAALKRRNASLADLVQHTPPIWTPTKTETKAEGIFGALRKKPEPLKAMTAQNMTVVKFIDTVLGKAKSIKLLEGNVYTPTTEQEPGSPNLLQWGNPIAWFTKSIHNHMAHHKIHQGTEALAVVPQAYMKGLDNPTHHTNALFFVVPSQLHTFYASLFPAYLKAEYKEFASVLEAYNNKTEENSGTVPDGAVVGVSLLCATVQVDMDGLVLTLYLDRWS